MVKSYTPYIAPGKWSGDARQILTPVKERRLRGGEGDVAKVLNKSPAVSYERGRG